MKKVVSLILVVLTIITVMFVGSVSASAGGGEGLPTRTYAETKHTSYAEANKHVPTHITTELPWQQASPAGSTVNEINPATYIIVAISILIVVLVSVMLIGYNVKKKKKSAAEDNAKKDEE